MDITIVGPNLRGTTHGKTFEIHKQDCRDLKKWKGEQMWNVQADTKVQVCDNIYPTDEFECKSGEFVYDLHFAPCCDKELQ